MKEKQQLKQKKTLGLCFFIFHRSFANSITLEHFPMNSEREVESFLDQRIGSFYCEVLPSRWSNIMQKLSQKTQQLKRTPLSMHSTIEMEWRTTLSLANALLVDEHLIIQEGSILCSSLVNDVPSIDLSSPSSSLFSKENRGRSKHTEDSLILQKRDKESSFDDVLVHHNSPPLLCSSTAPILAAAGGGATKGVSELHLFLSFLLTQAALKESILAEFEFKKEDISDETLRVYAHACIASFALVTKEKIDRLKLLLCSQE